MLAYYRNNLVHLFLNEAYLACVLVAFGETLTEIEGVPLRRLWK
jgi:glycerol-3-phosphate O-acyltransferase